MLLRTTVLSFVLAGFLLALMLASFIPVAADAQTGSPSVLAMLGGNCPDGWEAQAVEVAGRKWVSLGMYIPDHWVYAYEENPGPGTPSQMVFYEFSDIGCRSLPQCSLSASAQTVSPGSPVTISWSKINSMITSAGKPVGNYFNYTLGPASTGIVIPGYINIQAGSDSSTLTSQDISDSFVVYPQQTTTYTGTVRTWSGNTLIPGNWEAEASCSVTVNVGSAPPPACADRNYELSCSDSRMAPYRPAGATEGTVKFTLYSTSAGASCDGAAPKNVTHNCTRPPIPLTATCDAPTSAPVGNSVARTALPFGGTGIYTYQWNGTGGLTSTNSSSNTHTYTTNGTWTSSVTVTDSSGQSVVANCPVLNTSCTAVHNMQRDCSALTSEQRATYGIPTNATQGVVTFTGNYNGVCNAVGNVVNGCTVPTTPVCMGTLPANASAYTGDSTGTIPANTSWTYSSPNTSAKCEYTCNTGYTYQNGACVPATTAVNGSCGSANGGSGATAPSSNLCTAGTASWTDTLGTDGTFNWQCAGANGGTTASCVATKTATPTNATIYAPDCTIPAGSSSCDILVSWNMSNVQIPRSVRKDGVSVTTAATSNGTAVTLQHGTYTFAVYQGNTAIVSDTATAECATGSTWNGTVCTGTPPQTPTLTFSGSPTTISPGGASTLTWTVTNADSCWASGGWTGWKAFSGTNNQQVTPSVTTTYSLECFNGGVSSGVKNVVITVASNQCTGLIPSGASAYDAEESSGLNMSRPWAYASSDTNTKCQYRCDAGRSWNSLSSSCVQMNCPGTVRDSCVLQSTAPGGTSGQCQNPSPSRNCEYTCFPDGTWQVQENTCNSVPNPSGPPTITTNKPIVPSCESVELTPETNGHENCTISGGSFTNQAVTGDPLTAQVCANTTFTINCGDESGSVTVEVVGAQFET